MALLSMNAFIPLLVVFLLIFVIVLVVTAIGALMTWIQREREDIIEFTDPIKNIKESVISNCPSNIKNYNLKLSGDESHSGINIGRIVGYTRVIDENNDVPEEKKIVNVIAYVKTPKLADFFFIRMMKKIKLFAFYDYQLVSKLIGDVELMGVATRRISEFDWIIEEGFNHTRSLKLIENLSLTDYSADMTRKVGDLVSKALKANAIYTAIKEFDQQDVGSINVNSNSDQRRG